MTSVQMYYLPIEFTEMTMQAPNEKNVREGVVSNVLKFAEGSASLIKASLALDPKMHSNPFPHYTLYDLNGTDYEGVGQYQNSEDMQCVCLYIFVLQGGPISKFHSVPLRK